jgi:hypothetical protein
VAENGFGGNLKFELSEARLLTIAGDWVEDDLEELAGASIYRRFRRWRSIRSSNAATGDKREPRRSKFVFVVVACSSAMV